MLHLFYINIIYPFIFTNSRSKHTHKLLKFPKKKYILLHIKLKCKKLKHLLCRPLIILAFSLVCVYVYMSVFKSMLSDAKNYLYQK